MITHVFAAKKIPLLMNAEGWRTDLRAVAIYEPASKKMIAWAQRQLPNPLPGAFEAFLTKESNGLFFGDLVVFGIPPSLVDRKGLVRGRLQPLNLVAGNTEWISANRAVEASTTIGYVEGNAANTDLRMDAAGSVYACTKSRAAKWGTLAQVIARFL